MDSNLRDLTPEEAAALTKDLTDVLQKHGAEMGVKSTIELLKRVDEATEDAIPSPYGTTDKTEEIPYTPPEEGSQSDSGEPAIWQTRK